MGIVSAVVGDAADVSPVYPFPVDVLTLADHHVGANLYLRSAVHRDGHYCGHLAV
jgi:hypothetical protein